MTLRREGEFVRGPGQLAEVMRGFPGAWYVAGRWAIDLFLDRLTGHHRGIEIAVFRRDQSFMRSQFPGWKLDVVTHGQTLEWAGGQFLAPPVREVHATRTATARATDLTRIAITLHDQEGHEWVYGPRGSITIPADSVGYRAPAGLPILIPEIVLLEAAVRRDPEAEGALEAALPDLGEDGRAWLAWAIETAAPGHPWTARLEAAE